MTLKEAKHQFIVHPVTRNTLFLLSVCCQLAGGSFSGRVGFLGLGIMGTPMALNLIKAG